MLCVYQNNEQRMYKLMTGKSPNYVYVNLKKRNLNSSIKNIINKPFRLMNCIIKPYNYESGNFDTIYMDFLKHIHLPRGVFILNLNDSVIVSHDNDPFKILHPNQRLKNNEKYLPILSLSGKNNYGDIVIPTFDDIEYTTTLSKQQILYECNHVWNKKISKAVFRGGSTGCGLYPETNQRLQIAMLKDKNINAGIVGPHKIVKSNSIKIDPKKGVGQLYQPQIKTVPFMTINEQSNFKYIIHIDGNVGAYRLLSTMMTSSLIIRVMSDYTLWCDKYLIPHKHYIPVQSINELSQTVSWCIKNDDICKTISENGEKMAMELLNIDFIQNEIKTALNRGLRKVTTA
jgi:hypothetical protein